MNLSNSISRHRTTLLSTQVAGALVLAMTPLALHAVQVQNCGDTGPGITLRAAIASASPGETVDLTQLPVLCGSADSTITLLNGEIPIAQNDLTLLGPLVGSVAVVQSAGAHHRVFNHSGTGWLNLEHLTVSGGDVEAGSSAGAVAFGGCIASYGSVYLYDSTVTGCTASGTKAFGGGIITVGELEVKASTISANAANGLTVGFGGGALTKGGLSLKYSELTSNTSTDRGGGVYAQYPNTAAFIRNSTIAGNASRSCGGASLTTGQSVTISNSTFSYNEANVQDAALCIQGVGTVSLANSTFAFNSATLTSGGHAGGVTISGVNSTSLQSSIFYGNTAGSSPSDIFVDSSVISGTDNLVGAPISMLPNNVVTLADDPHLGPLQMNGGRTRTHALMSGSPALGAGNNAAGMIVDQRGYPRGSGPGPTFDIGAVEFDYIFIDTFGN